MGKGEADAGWEVGRRLGGRAARVEESQPARNKEGGGSADCARKRPLRSEPLAQGLREGGVGLAAPSSPFPPFGVCRGRGSP